MADKTGEAWRGDVDKYNCWEDLILTLGTYSTFEEYNPEKARSQSGQPIL